MPTIASTVSLRVRCAELGRRDTAAHLRAVLCHDSAPSPRFLLWYATCIGAVDMHPSTVSRALLRSLSIAVVGLPLACGESGGGASAERSATQTGGSDASSEQGTGGSVAGNPGAGGAAQQGGAGNSLLAGTGNAVPEASGGVRSEPTDLPQGGDGAHTCPDRLVSLGAGPGFPCDPGVSTTCADDDHRCECGASGIEGGGWHCVPSRSDCPAVVPASGDACSAAEPCDFVQSNARVRCTCASEGWSCSDVTAWCAVVGERPGESCSGREGEPCDYLRPAYAPDDLAANVPCTCGDDGYWHCADGCPLDFTGDDGPCDPAGPTNCSFRTDAGLYYCGCGSDGLWNCGAPLA
jgi:hypothetical protein